jgi:hypothetical protein
MTVPQHTAGELALPASPQLHHCIPAACCRDRYNYQDILLTYPAWNRTVAHATFSYATYKGTDNYIDMQDSSNFESIASSNK